MCNFTIKHTVVEPHPTIQQYTRYDWYRTPVYINNKKQESWYRLEFLFKNGFFLH